MSQRVSVFLAAYNGINWIEEQVISILNQEAVSVHIFISVDLSSDLTNEWCQQLEEENQNITVLEYGERFGGAAKNFYRLIRQVDFSSFDYIAFADQDDIWSLDKLSHGIKRMKHMGAEAYSASVIAFWEDGREKLIDKSQPQKKLDYLFEAAGPGCTYIFTNKAASLIKSYLRLIDSEPKVKYRQHGANQVGANTSLKGVIYRIKYILSDQVFESIALLIKVLDITSVQLSSRVEILQLAFKARQLRRRGVDQVLVFIALFFYAIKGPKK
jgi:rhamnosyltransferase